MNFTASNIEMTSDDVMSIFNATQTTVTQQTWLPGQGNLSNLTTSRAIPHVPPVDEIVKQGDTSDKCKIALGVFATCLYMPTMIFLWAVYRSKGKCCALSLDDFYGVLEVGEEGWFMRRMVCYKKRPFILEVLHLMCKTVLLVSFWTDISLVTPAAVYIVYDVIMLSYVIHLYRQGVTLTRHNMEFAWMLIYTVFGGFPVGSATKLVLAMWLEGSASLWVVPMPFMLFACLSAVFVPVCALVKALLIALGSQRQEGDNRRFITAAVVLVSSPLLCLWSYSFFVLENFIDPTFMMPVPTPTNCTCLALSPFLVLLLVFLVAMSFSSAYARSCQHFPELFTSWCIAFAAFDMLYVLDTSTGRNILVMPPIVLFMNILVHVVYDTILFIRIGQMSRSLPIEAVQNAQASRATGDQSKNQTKRRPAVFRCLDLESLVQLRVAIKLDICSICCEDYTGDDPSDVLIGLLKDCGHAYHFDCVWRWIDERRSCPLCRDTVAVNEDGMILLTLHDIEEAIKANGDSDDSTIQSPSPLGCEGHLEKENGDASESISQYQGEINQGFEADSVDSSWIEIRSRYNQNGHGNVPVIFHIS